MATEDKIYVIQSGRKSKQTFPNYRFDPKARHARQNKMLLLPDDRDSERVRRMEFEAERADLDRQRRELEQLRNELKTREDAQQQKGTNQGQRSTSAEEITAIISNVQNFQIDLKIPKFRDQLDRNPLEFLEEVERFFKIKNISNDRKFELVISHLGGKLLLFGV